MRWLKSYRIFESTSVEEDIMDELIHLRDEGFTIDFSYWVRGAIGGFLRSNEKGEQLYGPISDDGKLFFRVEVKKLKTSSQPSSNWYQTVNLGNNLGFDWSEVKPHFEWLVEYFKNDEKNKFKLNTIGVSWIPRFTTRSHRDAEEHETYQTSFYLVDYKFSDKKFTDRNTLTSVFYFFEKI